MLCFDFTTFAAPVTGAESCPGTPGPDSFFPASSPPAAAVSNLNFRNHQLPERDLCDNDRIVRVRIGLLGVGGFRSPRASEFQAGERLGVRATQPTLIWDDF